jgi:hypothetical protein
MRKKKRQTKRIYLLREVREIYDRLSGLGELRWNKIMAHCLDVHSESFSKPQVIDAQWVLYGEINRDEEDRFSLSPNGIPGVFTKVDKSPTGRAVIAAHRQGVAEKDAKRITTHRIYVEADVSKHLLPHATATRILELVGISPFTKELNA